MNIITAVAGIAGFWNSLIALSHMAVTTEYALMSAFEFKFCLRMIELKILPGNFYVTAVALFSQFPFMRVLLFMAVVTITGGFIIFFFGLMAF